MLLLLLFLPLLLLCFVALLYLFSFSSLKIFYASNINFPNFSGFTDRLFFLFKYDMLDVALPAHFVRFEILKIHKTQGQVKIYFHMMILYSFFLMYHFSGKEKEHSLCTLYIKNLYVYTHIYILIDRWSQNRTKIKFS